MENNSKVEDLGRAGYKLIQPEGCFKLDTAGVLLAWFAASFARKGSKMLELGSGSGGCSILTAARVPTSTIDCVELLDEPYEALKKNIGINSLESRMTPHKADVRELPHELKNTLFDVVFMNPPFYSGDKGLKTDTDIKSQHELIARFDDMGKLEDFVSAASSRAKMSSGFVVMCMTPSRLFESLMLYERYKIAPYRLINVHACPDKPSFLFLLCGKKGAPNAEFKVLPPLMMNVDGKVSPQLNRIYSEEHTDCFI